MPKVLQVKLFQELFARYSEGLVFGSGKVVIYQVPELADLFKELLASESYDLVVTDLANIDVITPSVAETIIEATTKLSSAYKLPILLLNVRTEVWLALNPEANWGNRAKMIWAQKETGEYDLIGNVPNKLRELLSIAIALKQVTAAGAVEALELEPIHKAIGNYSVYLQKLFKEGLVGRTKLTASQCDLERGWTYLYIPAPVIWDAFR